MGGSKLKHYRCRKGAEFVISPEAEKVALGASCWMRNYMVEGAKRSNDEVVLTITLPEGKPANPTSALILQFKPRIELIK